ncbi:MAG: hypothetical protein L3J35_05615 [Bacteroidales bacterium]|nr:hypothetical protein [Bacteroidales bacterium]
MKKYLNIIILLFLPVIFYSQGQSPNSVKWAEINTEYAQFIFPEEITTEAQRAANLIDYLYSFETKTLNSKPKKVPIILYNQSTTSNGFAALRPRRSVWFSTPSQYASDLGTDDWFYTLGTHEFRHIVQYSKNNKHFTKLLSIIFGQTGLLMGEYSIPYWFFEGDAVCIETALSKVGRGRISQFDMGIRTILLNDIDISYDKAKFRSYKTFYPGHYNLGYLMTSQAREIYGADVWDKTLNHTSKISFWPYAFSRGLKKTTGLNEKKLYKKIMSRLDSVWTKELKNTETFEANIINKSEKKSWTKYTEPNYLNDNQIIVKKSSLRSDITTFYIINEDGTEEKVKATDAGLISTAKNKVVWSRKYHDPRWQVRDYSDIIIFDINTKKEKRLTKNRKLFAPAISENGKTIVAVSYDSEMKTKLVLIDSETGKEIKYFTSPNNDFIRTPALDENAERVVFTRTNAKGTALSYIDLKTEIIYDLTEYTAENIGRPVFYKDFIIYNSPYSGIGNIYAINIKTKEKYQLTSAKYGAYNPKISDGKMIYINYGKNGYDIAEINLKEINFKPISEVEEYSFKTAENLQKQEQGKVILHPDLIPNKTYEVKKYKKLKHAFNIHSWGLTSNYPTYYDADYLQSFKPEIGAEIYTANMLNTVFGSAGIKYNTDDKTFNTNISYILKKYYPVFDFTSRWYQVSDNNYIQNSIGVNLPLNFSKGIYYSGINLNTRLAYNNLINNTSDYFMPSVDNFSALSYSGSIYKFRQQANQDINPKFGYFFYASYAHTSFESVFTGNQTALLGSVYLPGLINHHSINIKGGYERQNTNLGTDNIFRNTISYPRGYTFSAFSKINKISFDYSFPVWYPDFNIGPFAYLKRIRANLFFDYAEIDDLIINGTQNLQSTGLELLFQVYFFRLGEPIEIGGRFSYLLGNNMFSPDNIIPEFLILNIPF